MPGRVTTGSSNTPSTSSGSDRVGWTPAATSGTLACRGVDIAREVAMPRWASRMPKVAGAPVRGTHAKRDGTGSPGDRA